MSSFFIFFKGGNSQGATGLYLAKIEVDLTLSAIHFLSYTLVYYMSLVYEMPYWTS